MTSTSLRPRPLPTRLAAAAVAVTLGSGGAGCVDHDADARRMLAALSSARDQVCACRDLACAEAAEQALADFLLLHVDAFKKIPRPAPGTPDPVGTTAARLDGELRACLQQLAGAARPS